MKSLAVAFVIFMMMVVTVGCTSEDPVVEQSAAVNTEEPEALDEAFVVEQAATVVNTEESIEEVSEEAFSGYSPEIVPDSSHESLILRDIADATYRVWVPGDKPQTRWRCSKEVANKFRITSNTAVVEYNCILSTGSPDETGTVYVLANLASVAAIREVCWASELKGASRVVVCDISTYDTWFREFIERRIETAC